MNRLRELREERGLSQLEMIALIKERFDKEYSQQNISQFEKRELPPLEVIKMYMQIFGVSSDYILGLSKERAISEDLDDYQLSSKLGLSVPAVQTIMEYKEKAINSDISRHKELFDIYLSQYPDVMAKLLFYITVWVYYKKIHADSDDVECSAGVTNWFKSSQAYAELLDYINKLPDRLSEESFLYVLNNNNSYKTVIDDIFGDANTFTREDVEKILKEIVWPVMPYPVA